jgi:hypothetical protein
MYEVPVHSFLHARIDPGSDQILIILIPGEAEGRVGMPGSNRTAMTERHALAEPASNCAMILAGRSPASLEERGSSATLYNQGGKDYFRGRIRAAVRIRRNGGTRPSETTAAFMDCAVKYE